MKPLYIIFMIVDASVLSFMSSIGKEAEEEEEEHGNSVKIEITSITPVLHAFLANIGQNDHTNPYIESTTVLSGITKEITHTVRIYSNNS